MTPPTTATAVVTPTEVQPSIYYRPLYVLGLAFPERTMRPIAEALCTAEEIHGRGSHHAAVVYQMRKKGIKQTIVPVLDPETKNAYVWVLACSPSVNGGQRLKGLRLPPGQGSAILRDLRDRGVEKKFLNTFVEQMVEWPCNLVQPVWTQEKVEETKRVVRAAYARAMAKKNVEGAVIHPGASRRGIHRLSCLGKVDLTKGFSEPGLIMGNLIRWRRSPASSMQCL